MLSRKSKLAFSIAATLALITARPLLAGPWAMSPEGSNSAFGWSSIDDVDPTLAGGIGADGPLMGSPTVNENGFFFLSPNITVDANDTEVNSVNEWGVSISGTNVGNISIPNDNVAPNADLITDIIVRESGTYVSNDPLADFSVLATLVVTQVAPNPPLPFLPFDSVSAFTADVNFNPDGTWDVQFVFEADKSSILSPTGFDTFRLDLTNQLQLLPSGIANGSSITKLRSDVIIPEPASAAMLLLGSTLVLIRRR